MESFSMEIAGIVIRVDPLYESTREYCRAYLTTSQPEFSVAVTTLELEQEQCLLEQEAVEQGLRVRRFKEPSLERSFIQRRVADFLISRNILLLHGSAVSVDGEGYLFTAPCGTGKSTHTRLWRDYFGDRATMVNDDKPFLKITSNGVTVCGSPWTGKHGLGNNISVPLSGICLLRRGIDNRIQSSTRENLVLFLREQLHTPIDPTLLPKMFEMVDTLTELVPLWEMSCNKNVEAAKLSYDAMSVRKGAV